ncbi:cytochrome ubiquinol oxidase subunit I [Actinomycetospora sp. NBRC 106375]|uniref:cytochrome ubiquinol oxidase subunit I n=1 Tax=Actinomycetospora sp. NBRC 106375 TaxID=3032207 RepID=UPI0024A26059|nr:cytochrome ubiquinol oxidase subunit I [Actinomycetospora sp. NBRC 106375]GLZ48302.1 cytochrome ubiquinol oxidase subunit I [Actinomycetospora sp. NBRC 106375]
MSSVELARLQFASTSIYHFLFVPLTIGLALITAIFQTRWHRGDRDDDLRLTKFFGTLLVINIAVGVVTGLVQEFQFGMTWSGYARFVGDVFGAPLAMEGLAAFFLESTFLGLWWFGWDRLSRRVHLATIWAVAVGSTLSAAFIMAANSWMQYPVGYVIDAGTGRARLTDIGAVLTSPVFLRSFLHVLLAALVTAAVVVLAVSAWHLRRASSPEVFARSARVALLVLAPAVVLNLLVGSELGVTEGEFQPVKIAAAEAQWTTCQPCSFSLFQVGGGTADKDPTKLIQVPHLLSVLATNSWDGKVVGLNDLQAQYQAQYGPGDYIPNVFVQYWSMRVMAYLAGLVALLAVWGLWRRRRLASSPWFLRAAIWALPLPFVINTAGWMLTENGRQPWIVQGLQLTRDAASPSVGAGAVITSLAVFVLLYGLLAVVAWTLMFRHARRPPPAVDVPDDAADAPVPAPSY